MIPHPKGDTCEVNRESKMAFLFLLVLGMETSENLLRDASSSRREEMSKMLGSCEEFG